MRPFVQLLQFRGLFFELLKREFSSKYRGSFGGVIWTFAQPLSLLTIYTIAFGSILNQRWSNGGGAIDYGLALFAGLIVFLMFSEVVTKAPTLITGNPNLCKKVVFPLALLSAVSVASSVLQACANFAVWLLGYLLIVGTPHLGVVWFPLMLICVFPFLLGLSWLLSACSVWVRDIQHMTSVVSHAFLFLTPIFYSVESVPQNLRPILGLNPLTYIVEQTRMILMSGTAPDLVGLFAYFVGMCVFAALSLGVFQRLRPYFADLV